MRRIVINILLLAGIIAALCIALDAPAQTIHRCLSVCFSTNPPQYEIWHKKDCPEYGKWKDGVESHIKFHLECDHIWVEQLQDVYDSIPASYLRGDRTIVCIRCFQRSVQPRKPRKIKQK